MTLHRVGFVVGRFAAAMAVSVSIDAAEPIAFEMHTVDPQLVYSAGTVFDVNRDGKPDLVTGGRWFEAPDWKPHDVRQVEFINGRFDDYTCAPMDLNGDGWTDFIIANYRSKKLGWVENPGAAGGTWTEHVVDRPGPMETARLIDVDGDGQLDLLPNGRQWAAWWKIVPGTKDRQPQFIRHDLPDEAIGHGIGFGDINGDGRGDVVAPGGWLEAPEDRSKGRWLWHAEFNLRDASVPILVTDVDADGDNDVIWGMAHGTGVRWLEQTQQDGKRAWTQHVIDTSWSQPHTVELADLDGDGKNELIAGKRYMAHEGRDLGEYDPLVIYYYQFDSKRRTWQRHAIEHIGGPAGFDVYPQLADIDGDGDVDLFAPGRGGTYWFENRGAIASPQSGTTVALPAWAFDMPRLDREKLLTYRKQQDASPVATPADWALRRAEIQRGMQKVMGPLPDPSLRVPLAVEWLGDEDVGKYTRRKLTFATDPGDRVSAYLLVPKDLKKPAPAMLCLHPTGAPGKDIVTGLAGTASRHYAHELAERGYVCIVPDYPTFGGYSPDLAAYAAGERLNGQYCSGTMKAIWNNMRAIDLLETLPEVDADRIGAIGHSLGGHNALYTAAFELRIKAVVTSCGFTAFHDYYGGKLKGWTSDRYMPKIASEYESNPDRMPFDFHEVLGAIAPRSIFVCAPVNDHNFDVGGVRKVIASAIEVYKLLEVPDRLHVEYPDAAHDFPDAQRESAYAWLKEALKNKR